MTVHFLFNSPTAGGSIRASLQQLTDSGLGDFWQDSSTSFVTTAESFTDRSYPVTEQVVGNASVAYYGQADVAHAMTYTGMLIKGYHDTAASNVLVFSEVSYFRNGEEVDFTIAQDRTNTPVAKPFVLEMSRRADGTIVAMNNLYVSDVDVTDFAFDISPIVTDGVVVSTITNIQVSPAGGLGVTSIGPRDQLAVLRTDGSQLAGITYDVSCDVLTSDTKTLELNGKIVTNTTPN
jgi:hypothetical protein